jgi:CSLREA domain-containing protein
LGLGILLGVLLGGFFPLEAGIIFVNTYADVIGPGQCSLREAIIAANSDADFNGCVNSGPPYGSDVIVLGPGTFTLSWDPNAGDEDSANEDDLDITSPITIVISPPSGIATIARSGGCNLDGTPTAGEFRIFEVHPGGSLSATNVILENGCADGGFPDDLGGGIYVQSGASLNLSTSTVRQNRANGAGGGILNSGTATLTDTTLSQNSAGQAGGGLSDPGAGTLLRCTVEGNSAPQGGGIFKGDGGLTVLNSTISGNSSTFGGGILIEASTVNLVFSTVTNNSAPTGAGVRLGSLLAPTLNSKNSIVGGNTGGANCANFRGTINAFGANLDDDGSCTGFTNTPSLNLGPLANNGGPTQTHALLPGSSAINAVPSGQCTDLSSNPVNQDQRGVVRPQAILCDVGAFETVTAQQVQPIPTLDRWGLLALLAFLGTAGVLLLRRVVA